jgi:hypothetical protein
MTKLIFIDDISMFHYLFCCFFNFIFILFYRVLICILKRTTYLNNVIPIMYIFHILNIFRIVYRVSELVPLK